ncbi:MAG: hypothetical protein P4M12_03280 [Gammaproteobacteria bacterium]|nr:hypothetical protein [Gammaproteobacteria bacterium]
MGQGSSHDKSKRTKKTPAQSASSIKPAANYLQKLPSHVSQYAIARFLKLDEINQLTQVNKMHNALFQSQLSANQLLNLVVKYKLDQEKMRAAIAEGVNPIFKEVNRILEIYPELALKRGHITDQSGRRFHCSVLEYAHWSGNWALRNLIFRYAKRIEPNGEMRAIELIRAWNAKAYHYDLNLMCAEENSFPQLKKTPALIRQINTNKIFQWGDVNGHWQFTELNDEAKKIFYDLPFPNNNTAKSFMVNSDQITFEMYEALKKGHTVAHFDLGEYLRVADYLIKKYPVNGADPQIPGDERDADWYAIGRTQKKMPAWLAAIWCSTIPFDPVPDFRSLINLSEVCYLKLNQGKGDSFYNKELGTQFSIGKFYMSENKWAAIPHAQWAQELITSCSVDAIAMSTLSKVMTEERDEFNHLLPPEPGSAPGLAR